MHGRGRIDVAKTGNPIILIDDIGGQISRNDRRRGLKPPWESLDKCSAMLFPASVGWEEQFFHEMPVVRLGNFA